MKRLAPTMLSLVDTTSLILRAVVTGQVRGRELYNLMGSERLTTVTGTARVAWLPDGRSMLQTRRWDDSGTQFFRVDPVTQDTAALFEDADVDAIRRQ